MSEHDKFCGQGKDGQYTDMSCNCEFIAEVRRNQNKRIIKLLADTFGTSGIKTNVGGYVFVFDLAALIKGESQKRTENGTELPQGENK